MCGIVGAVAQRNVVPILIEGLKKLEYRGYDSAGIAVIKGTMQRVRSVGRVADLEARTREEHTDAPTGIAHTRWATHGGVTERNAHPHYSEGGGLQVSVVHNGIIENHEALRAELKAKGYAFQSETDTEVVAHLLAAELPLADDDLTEAMRRVCRRLEGALVRVAAYAQLTGKNLDLETIETLLREILQEEGKVAISIGEIQRRVADYFDIRLADMTSKRRPENIAFPRQIAMYLARQLTDHSLSAIGDAFGGRDHGTVLHACRKIDQEAARNEELRRELAAVREAIYSEP